MGGRSVANNLHTLILYFSIEASSFVFASVPRGNGINELLTGPEIFWKQVSRRVACMEKFRQIDADGWNGVGGTLQKRSINYALIRHPCS